MAQSSQPMYEFSADQNNIFTTLATRMRVFGTVSVLIGLLLLAGAAYLYGVLDEPAVLLAAVALNALYFLVLGGPTFAVSGGFRQIVETSHSDIDHLMGALDRLASIFFVNCIIVAILIVLQLLVPQYRLPDLNPQTSAPAASQQSP